MALHIFVLVLGALSQVPPHQTAQQRVKMAKWRKESVKASNDASKALLRYVDSPPFRSALSECCPLIAHDSAGDLVRRVLDEIEISELTHNFASSSGHQVVTGECC
jgi:hypothetical protein